MGLAENIKRLRQQKQLTQPSLATKASVSKGYVYMLEAGEMKNPSLDTLLKIAGLWIPRLRNSSGSRQL